MIGFQPSKASSDRVVKNLTMAFLKKHVQGHFPAQSAFFSQSWDQQKFLLDAFHSIGLAFISSLKFHYPLYPKEAKFIACK